MAKIKKRILRWAASQSNQVVGYKLYWQVGDQVTYSSTSVMLGNVTEVVLPDDVKEFSPETECGPIEFGIAAVDELGNESDFITITAPYQFNIPKAPGKVWLDGPDDKASEKSPEEQAQSEPLLFLDQDFDDEDEAQVHRISDNVVGNDSFRNRQNISVALRQPDNS